MTSSYRSRESHTPVAHRVSLRSESVPDDALVRVGPAAARREEWIQEVLNRSRVGRRTIDGSIVPEGVHDVAVGKAVPLAVGRPVIVQQLPVAHLIVDAFGDRVPRRRTPHIDPGAASFRSLVA